MWFAIWFIIHFFCLIVFSLFMDFIFSFCILFTHQELILWFFRVFFFLSFLFLTRLLLVSFYYLILVLLVLVLLWSIMSIVLLLFHSSLVRLFQFLIPIHIAVLFVIGNLLVNECVYLSLSLSLFTVPRTNMVLFCFLCLTVLLVTQCPVLWSQLVNLIRFYKFSIFK